MSTSEPFWGEAGMAQLCFVGLPVIPISKPCCSVVGQVDCRCSLFFFFLLLWARQGTALQRLDRKML